MSALSEQIERARELEMATWEALLESISKDASKALMAYEVLRLMRELADRTLIWGERLTLPDVEKGLEGAIGKAEQVLAWVSQECRTRTVDLCEAWLLELLRREGAQKPQDIVRLAEPEGFCRSTLYRTRALLGDRLRNTRGRQDPRNEWELVE